MTWYAVLVPAVIVNVLIRLDGFLLGPYWAFSELVPGLGSTDADFWLASKRIRRAVIRRFTYPGVALFFFTLYDLELVWPEAALIGTVTACLLLWPMVFYGLPLGVARTDWLLLPLFVGVIGGFAASAVTGHYIASAIIEEAGGDWIGWLRDQIVGAAIGLIATVLFAAFFRESASRLVEKKRRREAGGYERL